MQDGETARLVVDSNPATVGELEPGEERLEPLPCPAKKSDEGKKIRAQFARKRVHNEQTLMFPCGIFFARASFYNAEAVSNVLVGYIHPVFEPVLILGLDLPQACLLCAARTRPRALHLRQRMRRKATGRQVARSFLRRHWLRR